MRRAQPTKVDEPRITRSGLYNALTLKGAHYARIVVLIGVCGLGHAYYKMKTRKDEEEF